MLDNQVELMYKTSDAIKRYFGQRFIAKNSLETNVLSGHAFSTIRREANELHALARA